MTAPREVPFRFHSPKGREGRERGGRSVIAGLGSERPKILRTLLACVVLTWIPAGAGLAQTPDPDLESFDDRTDVLEVRVPVNVTDKNGEPIRGLTAEDFEIQDNGKARDITRFEVIDLQTLTPEPGYERVARETIPPAARRHFLFLFDFTFSSPLAVLRARQAAQQFVVESMHPTDLGAVATHSIDQGPRLVLTFTPDRAQLARAIDTLGVEGEIATRDLDPLRFIIEDVDNTFLDSTSQFDDGANALGAGSFRSQAAQAHLDIIAKGIARSEKSFARGRISSWTRSMGGLVRLLGSVPGRKHVVFFTEGFDGRLLLGRQPDADDPDQRSDTINALLGNIAMVDNDDRFGNSQLQNDVLLMLEEFKRADAIFQIVDISGLRADMPDENRKRRVGRDALFWMADHTGGALYEDANDFGHQLREVLERSEVTYVLSFQPDDIEYDGSRRRLKIKADLPRGSQLSHRTGYYAPRPYEEMHPLEKNLMAANMIAAAAPKHDIALEVLAAPFRATAETAYVPVILEAPGASLLVDHDGDALPIEVYAYVTDDQGRMRDFFTQIVTLDLGRHRETFSRTGFKYYGHLELPEGQYLVRVLVRNALTGRTGVQTLDLEIPSFDDELAVLPPFFLEDPGLWFLVREQSRVDQDTTVYPFTLGGQPYVPAARPVLEPNDDAEVCVVAYNLGHGAPDISSEVLRADGTRVEGGRLTLEERTVTGIGGLDKLRVRFRPEGLEAGSYTLAVSVTDPNTEESTTGTIPFRIDS